jgi:polyphosphate kinase
MRRTDNPDPLQLFHRVQSKRLSLARRLRALGQLAKKLDSYFCQAHPDGRAPATLHPPAVAGDGAEESAPLAPAAAVTPADAGQLLHAANQIARGQLLPRLPRYHVRLAAFDELTESQLAWLHAYFRRSIYPLLTPLAVDPAHPFPQVAPGPLYFLVTLRAFGQLCRLRNGQLPLAGESARNRPGPATKDGTYMDEREIYGLVNLAGSTARLVRVQPDGAAEAAEPTLLLWREEIIRHFIATLFVEMEVTGVYQFRVLRATRPSPAADDGHDHAVTENVPPRPERVPVVHIDVEQGMPPHLVQWLVDHLHASGDCVLPCAPPLAMGDLDELVNYL